MCIQPTKSKGILSNISFRRCSQNIQFQFSLGQKNKENHPILWKMHTHSPEQRESTHREHCQSLYGIDANAMQHSTVYIAQSKCTKITICLAAGQPLNIDHTIYLSPAQYHNVNLSLVCVCGWFAERCICFLWNQFQDILPDSENWFHFRNLYLWTKKTQTTVWIHCIVKQSISLYSDGLVWFGSDRFKHSEFHFRELIIIVHINWFPLKISNEKLSVFLFYSVQVVFSINFHKQWMNCELTVNTVRSIALSTFPRNTSAPMFSM